MKINLGKVFLICVIIICIFLVGMAIYISYIEDYKKASKIEEIIVDENSLKSNFNNIFDNTIDYQNNILVSVNKKDINKELVYTNHEKQLKGEGEYDINISIPYININNNIIDGINKEIEALFYNKINTVQSNQTDSEIIYSVKYKAYLNENILSLVIYSYLKEDANRERVMIKTYNYNISSNQLLNLNNILNYRSLDTDLVQNKIFNTINESQKVALENKNIDDNIYLRDINDIMYKVENTKEFFLGTGKSLYILYPYGNSDYTTELDLIVI